MPDETDLQDEYRMERRAAGLRYQVEHPEGYYAILKTVMLEYDGHRFREKMQTVQLRCARAGGFPEWKTWKATRMAGATE